LVFLGEQNVEIKRNTNKKKSNFWRYSVFDFYFAAGDTPQLDKTFFKIDG
jgi:hypothetical protein